MLSCIYEFVQLLEQLFRSQRSESLQTQVAQSQCVETNTRTQAMRLCQDTWQRDVSTSNPIHLDVSVQQTKHENKMDGLSGKFTTG